MGFFNPIGKWFKGAANAFSKATTDKKIGNTLIKAAKGLKKGTAYAEEGIKLLVNPKTQAKFIVKTEENRGASAKTILDLINLAVKNEMANVGVLISGLLNDASYVFFPEFDGQMAILESMGDASLETLINSDTQSVIELPLKQELKMGIIQKRNLKILNDGSYQITDTVGTKSGFTTEIHFTPTKLPPI